MFQSQAILGRMAGSKNDPEQIEDHVWPAEGLDSIPDWVYTSDAIYEREVERIFHGRTWNFVALEAEIPNAGDYKRSYVGPTPVVVSRAEDGIDPRLREPLRAPRRGVLPQRAAATTRNSSARITSGRTT